MNEKLDASRGDVVRFGRSNVALAALVNQTQRWVLKEPVESKVGAGIRLNTT